MTFVLIHNPKPVDNEIHFIYDCSNNQNQRNAFYNAVGLQKDEIDPLSVLDKTELFRKILEDENRQTLAHLAKFVYLSENQRKINIMNGSLKKNKKKKKLVIGFSIFRFK